MQYPSKRSHRTETHVENEITVHGVVARLQELKEEEKRLVRPDNPNLQTWDLVILGALLFTASVTPYEVAFVPTNLDALFGVNRFVDVLFVIDMVLQFKLMYYHANGRLVKSEKLIRQRYLNGWFTIDLLTVLPYDTTKFMFSEDSAGSNAKLFRLIRLCRLVKLLRLLRASRIFSRWQTRMGMQHGNILPITYGSN